MKFLVGRLKTMLTAMWTVDGLLFHNQIREKYPTNRELTALVNTLPLARTYAFGWQGRFATRVNIESSNIFEVRTSTGVVQGLL